ncbi:MAG: apolipoprotein N-acyltransferase [Cellvibrio sp.]
MNKLILRQLGWMSLGALALGASFVYEHLFLLPWICFVPFLLALNGVSIKRAYCLGLAFGCLFFIIASYWIVGSLQKMSEINRLQAIAVASIYWVYCAQQYALLASLVVWLGKCSWGSEWLSLSLFSTLLFYFFPLIFPADLSVTQTKFLLALQAIDITGALGLHFLILLHNGLIYAVLKSSNKCLGSYQYFALTIMFAWFIYGTASYRHWSLEQQRWPSFNIGVVQPHSPASIEIPSPPVGYSRAYSLEIEMSDSLAKTGADLIVWPEARYRGFFNEAYVYDAFKFYQYKSGVPLLIQDLHIKNNLTFNSAAMIGVENVQQYPKRLRIPFGEYLPWVNIPLLGNFIAHIFGDFYTPIAAGEPVQAMNLKKINIQPLICFEVANAFYVADVIKAASVEKKPTQMLIVQSNDSWFDTHIEPSLHLTTSQLRSIEHRLPLLHALNNGPSSVYAVNGQLTARFPANERAAEVIKVTYPEQIKLTWFAKFPYGFIFFMFLFTIGWVSLRILQPGYKPSISS